MNRFYKRLGIVFIMAFAIMLGCFTNVLAADNAEIGVANLNNTPENSAKVGDEIIHPEKGWKRYDDTDGNIKYIGNGWQVGGNVDPIHFIVSNEGEIRFNFVGTKLRIVGPISVAGLSSNIKIIIDNNLEQFSEKGEKSSLHSRAISYEKLNLSNKEHSVKIICNNDGNYAEFNYFDIDSTGELKPYNENPPAIISNITLNKSTDNLQVGKTDTLTATITPDNVTNKIVKWESSNKDIATVDENGVVTAKNEGKTTITATTTDGSNLSAKCIVTVTTQVPPVSQGVVLNVEPEKTKIKKNETVSANLVIDNIKEIAAEDVRIKYDNTKLQFLGMGETDGIKLVKSDTQPGELRVIVASKGSANVVNAKKTLLKLNFKGIAAGEALVDVTKGRISDGITMEKDLTDAECGQATITIEDLKDVNNSGEFTLLDLAIDARHLGEDPKTLAQYNTDIVENNAIDDDDLLKIGEYMLANPNYKF
ncbi:Ig-like domain-containing protein [Clostridium sp. OS1-26]|uniref:Ig-like domain-containing protein n=1 Tax=Clostridium sp. OS1-26 TaxID=3070681 RepID=UPI0027DF8DCB|nr:Ig-like domain-containing protein [Clostridium sp. OS1-26]WML33349.1 Ig-like domain-containing protein [Clostridium sp. OS1-26]